MSDARTAAIAAIDDAFGGSPKPSEFMWGTCRCDECLEHDETMRQFELPDLPLDKLDKPGWDPICFASHAAFHYLMPGLARLVLAHADEYVQQFFFHAENPDRVASFSPDQARALVLVLDALVADDATAIENNCSTDDLWRLRATLERVSR
jgi:hypothetical protein